MNTNDFRKHAHELVDWVANYWEGIESLPVTPGIAPGSISDRIPADPPEHGESFPAIFDDFRKIIVPGMTHWQHPSFFAYFPANISGPSVLAEMLTAAMGAQCMSWATSPAATELEERMMEWLRGMIGLPAGFTGVLQDTASTATLCSILSAREARSKYGINDRGFRSEERFTAYCSEETHSSIEKGVKIAGIGRSFLRKLEVDEQFAMKPDALDRAIREDLQRGYTPLHVTAAIGTTGSTAIDPLRRIGEICRRYHVWLHVDAAFAGTALLLPELRWMIDGVEQADSFVFNPHKWMFTNFDCSAYFVKDVSTLVRTFEILPEYLKTREGKSVNNYRDWGIQLGRRFRALKLWFVIRSFGVEGLRSKIKRHIQLAQDLSHRLAATPDFELLAPIPLNTLCFRYHPSGITNPDQLDELNARLLERLNETGRIFLTHTKLKGAFTIRMVIGQTEVEQRHVDMAWQMIESTARALPIPSPVETH